MKSIAARLRSMGTTLGQQAANTVLNQDQLIVQLQDDASDLRAALNTERTTVNETKIELAAAQRIIEQLSETNKALHEQLASANTALAEQALEALTEQALADVSVVEQAMEDLTEQALPGASFADIRARAEGK